MKEAAHAICGLPRTLAETGKIQKEDLPKIAEASLDDGTVVMNPVDVTFEDALAVLERAWGG